MIETALLKQVIEKQNKYLTTNLGIKRLIDLKPIDKFATIVSGIRRCGKSTFLKQILSKRKIIYYIHFEDISLTSFELTDFNKLDNIFEEIYGKNGVYFFDEIQNVKGWEIYVRSLVDTGKEIYITGSNASMLSKELGTRLTGRYIRKELFPFNFQEFCNGTKIAPSLKAFDRYLIDGGMPEFVLQKDIRILQELIGDIIFRDILERSKISDSKLVREIVSYLLSNCGKEISYSKLAKLFSVGSVSTISLIMDALEDSYVIFQVPKFDYSLKKQIRNLRKIYCIDNGFVSHVSFQVSPNKGRLLENLVLIELIRDGHDIYYHKDKKECDFVIKEGINVSKAFQVCYELNDDNRQREYSGLLEALDRYGLKQGTLLTHDESDELFIENKKIIIKPVWKWLMENTR